MNVPRQMTRSQMTRSENERTALGMSQFDTEGDGKKSLRRRVTAGRHRQTSRGGRAGAVAWFFFITRGSSMVLIRFALGAIAQRLSRMLSTQLMTRSCRSCRRASAEPSMHCTASSLSQSVSRIYSWTASSYACSTCSASRSMASWAALVPLRAVSSFSGRTLQNPYELAIGARNQDAVQLA
jgi:hypothetical protein